MATKIVPRCEGPLAAAVLAWFRHPDAIDHPAPLAQELEWLRGAGYKGVDVVWADCGHAIFCGFRGR
jgi:hypothetical protein